MRNSEAADLLKERKDDLLRLRKLEQKALSLHAQTAGPDYTDFAGQLQKIAEKIDSARGSLEATMVHADMRAKSFRG